MSSINEQYKVEQVYDLYSYNYPALIEEVKRMFSKPKNNIHKAEVAQFRTLSVICFPIFFVVVLIHHIARIVLFKKNKKSVFSETREIMETTIPFAFN